MNTLIKTVVPEIHLANRPKFVQWLGRTLHKASGWKVEGEIPNLKKFILVGAPHTSNWDFVHALILIWAVDLKLNVLAKHTLFKIPILKNNIHDNTDNTTRFIVIGNQNIGESGNDKTSILISIDNKSGALNSLLEPLSKNKISMSKIESIPTKINNWEYMFLLDIEGHIDDKLVKESLKEIQKKSIFFKNLGSYPRSI